MPDKRGKRRRVDRYTAPVSRRTFSPLSHRPRQHRPFTDYAVDNLDLDIADSEFLVLVGPSGCGKSTTLRMLAGLESIESGQITIGNVDVTHLPPRARDVVMVFQNYALYPNMTVAGNMGFALRNAGPSRAETQQRVLEVADMLEPELLDRKPSKLSGGQRQRVAMGRAIVRRPRVFCMDEPLSNLDAKLRVSTRSQISGLQQRLGTTTVYVTHDQVEAMTMGDRVAVLKDGVLQQVDTPRALYDNPVNTFVATFIGAPAMNLIDAAVADGAALLHDLSIPAARPAVAQNRVLIGVRPESWDVASADAPGALTVHVELAEELGFESFVYATPAQQEGWSLRAQRIVFRTDRRTAVRVGESLSIVPHPREVWFFDSQTETRIR
jgi:sn-glycerol 3-phosphate transport system ATP-binding protein